MIVVPLLEKIFLLESKLGEKYSHTTFEPFKFNSADPLRVQDAGKKISEFIGLKGLTFIISYTRQKAGVGGHIELEKNSDVFIEIDDKYKTNSDIVLSILAHEICHKYLYINNVKLFPEYENEILTDLATVYTGLGKLSLNGCETITKTSTVAGNKTTTTTTTNNVGYLNRSQFAFAYKIICTMRKVPLETVFQNLSIEAVNEIKNIEANQSAYFDKNFFNNEFPKKMISDAMSNEIGNSQINFARLNKNIRELEESIINIANKLIKDFHDVTKTELEKINGTASMVFNNDSYNFIKNLTVAETLESLKIKSKEKDLYAQKLIDSLSIFTSFISENYPTEYNGKSLEFLFQFKCPACNHKMRIGEKKLARVKCPQCNYSFIANTGVQNVQAGKGKKTSNKKSDNSFGFLKNLFNTN